MTAAAAALPDDEATAGATFAAALGRPLLASDAARLHRAHDGTWLVAVHAPRVRDLGDLRDVPWAHSLGLESIARDVPIDEGVRLILDVAGADAEVRRREGLWAAEQRRRHDQEQAERAQRIRDEAERQQRQRAERDAYERYGGNEWGFLPLESKILYSLAIAVDAGGDLSAELRRLALAIEKSKTLPFPGKEYRR